MKTITLRLALALFVSTVSASPALAQGGATTTTRPSTQKSQHDREMTVSPAKAEDAVPPGQKADPFAFSQDALELRNENAATLYLQAFPMNFGRTREQWTERMDELEKTPIDQIDVAAVREALAATGQPQYPGTGLAIAESAVRRTWADWGSPLQEKGIETLLPYLNESRTHARLLALEARLLAREEKHDEAAQILRRLYVLGQHVGNAQQPVLIDGLVGVGIAALATDRAAQIAQLESAPNRYWALTTLPSPMFDVPKWMRSERIFLTVSLPALRDPENMTSEEWAATLRKFRTYMTGPDSNTTHIEQLIRDTAATAEMAAAARPYLKARGYRDERLDAMGPAAVLATYMMDDYRSRFDAITKLVYLPFPQALPLLVEQEKRMTAREGQPGPGLLADVLLPAMTKALAAPYRLERQIAALRIVEAVRDHAAHHEGALPATLAEVRLPIPQDPMTGEAFGYEVSGNTFTITARRYLPDDINSGFVWRVTMRK